MYPNELKITVEGTTGAGKSGVGQYIANMLNAVGIEATFIDLDGIHNEQARVDYMKGRVIQILHSLVQQKTRVTIIEKQATRTPYNHERPEVVDHL